MRFVEGSKLDTTVYQLCDMVPAAAVAEVLEDVSGCGCGSSCVQGHVGDLLWVFST